MENNIELQKVTKKYKGFELKDISFNVPKGCVIGLIGENGAGKTTTIKSILNITKSDGTIKIFGKNNKENEKKIKEEQAMFMNCDHSMLTYRIYRTPKVILGIFKERLKTLITINLLPATLIGLGLALLLFLSGGTNNQLNYVVLFVSIISMSIFFSVHYLVMYYLLQPYNVSTEMKSSTYKVVQGLTYIVCWYMIQIQMPIFTFGIATIVFCIAYCLISLFLAYKYAPKTFKLRV